MRCFGAWRPRGSRHRILEELALFETASKCPPRSGRMNVSGELAGRWRTSVVLKRDLFSTVERGRFLAAGGEVDAVLRCIDEVPWWTWAIARHFLWRERTALAAAGGLGVTAPLLFAGRGFL